MTLPKAPIRSYRDLLVWRASMDLVIEVYEVSATLPKVEIYGLTSQMRRAAISVPSNIAEGHGRDGIGEYLYHLSVANGSIMELETQLLIALRMQYVEPNAVKPLLARTAGVGRMLAGLTRKLKERRSRRPGTPDT